jgi:hypothetical protein
MADRKAGEDMRITTGIGNCFSSGHSMYRKGPVNCLITKIWTGIRGGLPMVRGRRWNMTLIKIFKLIRKGKQAGVKGPRKEKAFCRWACL